MFNRVLHALRSNLLGHQLDARAGTMVCLLLILLAHSVPGVYGQTRERSYDYAALQKRLAKGWNTWDVHSVTTHVLLPAGLALRVGLQRKTTLNGEAFLGDVLIGGPGRNMEQVFPGSHAWDGSYTDLRLAWPGLDLRIQSAHAGDDLVILVSPVAKDRPGHLPATVVFSAAYLWNRPGTVAKLANRIEAHGPTGTVAVYLAGVEAPFSVIPVYAPYLSAELNGPVGLSTGQRRSLEEIQKLVEEQRQAYEQSLRTTMSAAMDAIQTTLGWDTIYEPEGDRVISPVSRSWSVDWGGYVLFDWDSFFAATLAAIGDHDLAYANAIETLREETLAGFVGNYARSRGWKSSDRSEPPIGAISVLGVYRKFHERWLLEETFAPLLAWNRWWQENRSTGLYLEWGSDGKNQPENMDDSSRGTRQGAIFESGLDNSPMYDAGVFDEKTQRLEIADVGLLSLYVADCEALAEITAVLGKPLEGKELRERAKHYRASLASLWDEKTGMFLNKDLRTGELSPRTSPTNFYPLLARAATPQQAQRMIQEHLLNPQEFWGEWVIPATPRNDPAFKDQNYWRGRIWGPMNFLVYLGLRNYDQAQVREELGRKSFQLFQGEWSMKHHVHENYNAMTGAGDDVTSSDPFYHWGALLALIEYMETQDKPSRTVLIQ